METLKMMALEKNDDGLYHGFVDNASDLRELKKDDLIELVQELDTALKTATEEYDEFRYNELLSSIMNRLA